MLGYFLADQQSDYYQSSVFTRVLQFVQSHPHHWKIKEKTTRNGLRLQLIFDNIRSVDSALEALQPFVLPEVTVS
jgi:transcription-repair coupling factor (superfamily II helicase)